MADADGRSGASAELAEQVAGFIGRVRFSDLPDDVVVQAQRCLLDLIGVAAAGACTRAARIVSEHAATELLSTDHCARLLFDGRASSRAGAAFAGAATLDAFDAHDGHVLTKGHVGVAVLPALLSFMDGARPEQIDAREFITSLVLGYEIGTRAG